MAASLELESARVALGEGRLSMAMVALARAWSEVRDPAIARALERLGHALSEIREPLEPTQKGWMEREAEGNPADTGLLTETLYYGEPGKERLGERVQRLCQRDPDPRAFAAMMERVRNLPWSGYGPNYQKLLERHVDPRIPMELRQVPGRTGRESWQRRLDRVAKIAAALDTGPVPGSETLGAAVDAALQTPRDRWLELPPPARDDVLDAVWDAVLAEEPGARLVFADRVGERDPDRATFIQLQIAAADGTITAAQVRALKKLEKRKLEFLGDLAPAVNKTGLMLERGFLLAGNAITASEDEARALGDRREWGTARALWAKHVSFYEGAGVAGLWSAGASMLPGRDGVWRSVRGGKALEAPQLRKLARKGPWPWKVLQLRPIDSQVDRVLEDLPKLKAPHLHTLVLCGYSVYEGVPACRPEVRTVVLEANSADNPVRIVRAMPHLTRMEVGERYVLERRDRWTVRFLDGMEEAMRQSHVFERERRELLDELGDLDPVYGA